MQVALEQYRRTPDSVDALILISGAHGRVLERSFSTPVERMFVTRLVRSLRVASPALQPVLLPLLRSLARRRFAAPLLSRLGLFARVSPSIRTAIHDVLTLQYDVYLQMGLLANEHDTEDLLPHVAVPTLVIGGTHDIITRSSLARAISQAIPHSLYREVSGATHYGIMEFPEAYARHILDFLGREGAGQGR